MALRAEKKIAARSSMQRAALELVAERGSTEVTVDDIADAAGVSTRTFFNYFATKEESLFSMPPQILREVIRDLATRPADEHPFASMRHVIDLLLAHVEEDPDETRLRHVVAAREPALVTHLLSSYTEFEAIAATAIRERTPSHDGPHGRTELIVASCVTALFTAIRSWSAAPGGPGLREICTAHLDALEHGLRR